MVSTRPINKTPAHDALLKKAWELLVEHNGDIRAIKMDTVVKAAGLSSGAFYNIWPGGLQDFQQSLLEYAIDEGHIAYLDDLIADLAKVTPETMTLAELVRVFSARDSQLIQADPAFRVQVALWARHVSDVRVAEVLGESYRCLNEKYAKTYETVTQVYGRRWCPPWTPFRFATVVTALAEGLAIRRAVDPHSVPQDIQRDQEGDSPWDLFGITVAAILTSATEKDTDADPRYWSDMAELGTAPGVGRART